jgi:hypothetical protein
MKRIVLIANGPSGDSVDVRTWRLIDAEVIRVNHWYVNAGGAMGSRCDHWFIGEHRESWLPLASANLISGNSYFPQVWCPGFCSKKCAEIQKHIKPRVLRVQKEADLPFHCRWTTDPAPMRPTNGSLALALAVSMRPDELFIAGIDLYSHSSKVTHSVVPPDFQGVDNYYQGRGNHNIIADLRYIRAALSDFSGHVVCVGSTLKRKMGLHFPKWDWRDG